MDLVHDEKMAVLYVAGYVAHQYTYLFDNAEDLADDLQSSFNYLNRGGLTIPSSPFLQLMFMGHVFFHENKSTLLQKETCSSLEKFSKRFKSDAAEPKKRKFSKLTSKWILTLAVESHVLITRLAI